MSELEGKLSSELCMFATVCWMLAAAWAAAVGPLESKDTFGATTFPCEPTTPPKHDKRANNVEKENKICLDESTMEFLSFKEIIIMVAYLAVGLGGEIEWGQSSLV